MCIRDRPYPLGATWDGEGVNFALFAEHADKVELCLFDDSGRQEQQRIELGAVSYTHLDVYKRQDSGT